MLTPKENPEMPDGWHYEQFYMGKWIRIDAESLSNLHHAVMQFRIGHKIHVGDVLNDVNDWICSKYPHQCRETNVVIGASAKNTAHEKQSFTSKVTEWASSLLPTPKKYVSDALSNKRQEACMGCKHNVPLGNACPSCVGNMNQILYLLRAGKGNQIQDVEFCNLHNFHIHTASTLQGSARPQGNQPSRCWVKEAE
jgi:hypothetical protein